MDCVVYGGHKESDRTERLSLSSRDCLPARGELDRGRERASDPQPAAPGGWGSQLCGPGTLGRNVCGGMLTAPADLVPQETWEYEEGPCHSRLPCFLCPRLGAGHP